MKYVSFLSLKLETLKTRVVRNRRHYKTNNILTCKAPFVLSGQWNQDGHYVSDRGSKKFGFETCPHGWLMLFKII
jgi:hypothetical protein